MPRRSAAQTTELRLYAVSMTPDSVASFSRDANLRRVQACTLRSYRSKMLELAELAIALADGNPDAPMTIEVFTRFAAAWVHGGRDASSLRGYKAAWVFLADADGFPLAQEIHTRLDNVISLLTYNAGTGQGGKRKRGGITSNMLRQLLSIATLDLHDGLRLTWLALLRSRELTNLLVQDVDLGGPVTTLRITFDKRDRARARNTQVDICDHVSWPGPSSRS